MKNKINCLLVEPNKLPKRITIENSLKAKQEIVGGYIEACYLPDDDNAVIICNEEGKLLGMPLNRTIGPDIIAGPFLIVGDDYETGDFKSLTEEQMQKYESIFDEKSIKESNKKIISIIEQITIERFKKQIEERQR